MKAPSDPRKAALRTGDGVRLASSWCSLPAAHPAAETTHKQVLCSRARTSVDKVRWELPLRLPILLPVEERLRARGQVVLPLQGGVVQAHVVEAAAARQGLPVPVVLAPLEACGAAKSGPAPCRCAASPHAAGCAQVRRSAAAWRQRGLRHTCAGKGGAVRVVGEAGWQPRAGGLHQVHVEALRRGEQPARGRCQVDAVCSAWAQRQVRPRRGAERLGPAGRSHPAQRGGAALGGRGRQPPTSCCPLEQPLAISPPRAPWPQAPGCCKPQAEVLARR